VKAPFSVKAHSLIVEKHRQPGQGIRSNPRLDSLPCRIDERQQFESNLSHAAFAGALNANTRCPTSERSAIVETHSRFRGTEMKQMAGDSNAVGNVRRLPGVCRMTGLGRSTIYRMEAAKQFPQRIKLGLRAVGWMESEVQGWLTMRAKAREAARSYVAAE
jgi:prophage regulatory protein